MTICQIVVVPYRSFLRCFSVFHVFLCRTPFFFLYFLPYFRFYAFIRPCLTLRTAVACRRKKCRCGLSYISKLLQRLFRKSAYHFLLSERNNAKLCQCVGNQNDYQKHRRNIPYHNLVHTFPSEFFSVSHHFVCHGFRS